MATCVVWLIVVNKRFLQLTGHPSADIDLVLSREVNRQGQRNLSIHYAVLS